MRNAAVPILFHRDLDKAQDAAWRQAKSTHQGDESADCTRLLAYICVQAINMNTADMHTTLSTSKGGSVLPQLIEGFVARFPSVQELAFPSVKNDGTDSDENWNWKCEQYRYSSKRAAENPGYVGSYAMDCMAMSLWCVYSTSSFAEAVLTAANLCGDADTVAAVTGQMAGALYGFKGIPPDFVTAVERWDASSRIRARVDWLVSHAADASL